MFAEKRTRQRLSSTSADGQLNAIGCLPMILPFVLLSASANEERAVGHQISMRRMKLTCRCTCLTFDLLHFQVSAAVEFVKLTHPHPKVPTYVSIYSRALHAVLGGAGIRQQAEHALRRLGVWEDCQSYSRKAARYERPPEQQASAKRRSISGSELCVF